jgi:hypothetical protein
MNMIYNWNHIGRKTLESHIQSSTSHPSLVLLQFAPDGVHLLRSTERVRGGPASAQPLSSMCHPCCAVASHSPLLVLVLVLVLVLRPRLRP